MLPNSTDQARARWEKADAFAQEIVAIADEIKPDDKEALARAKFRVEVRMWLMTRLAPHAYGTSAPKQTEPDPKVSFLVNTKPQPEDG